MRTVLDTNVFISSFLDTGSPRKIIDLWKGPCIVSGDKKVLSVKDYAGIEVLSPKQFIEKL